MESWGNDDVSSLNVRKYLGGNDDVKAGNACLLHTLSVITYTQKSIFLKMNINNRINNLLQNFSVVYCC